MTTVFLRTFSIIHCSPFLFVYWFCFSLLRLFYVFLLTDFFFYIFSSVAIVSFSYYSVNLRIQSKCGKNADQKNYEYGHFLRSNSFSNNAVIGDNLPLWKCYNVTPFIWKYFCQPVSSDHMISFKNFMQRTEIKNYR